ncbi:LOW QUALITY PROTEIN: C8orf82 isoform 5, partial [Pongo abelii]
PREREERRARVAEAGAAGTRSAGLLRAGASSRSTASGVTCWSLPAREENVAAVRDSADPGLGAVAGSPGLQRGWERFLHAGPESRAPDPRVFLLRGPPGPVPSPGADFSPLPGRHPGRPAFFWKPCQAAACP